MHKSMLRISKSITRPSHVSTNAKSVETTTSQQNSNNQKKMLTLKQIWSNLFSAVRKNPNTKKVMMTTEQILKEIESVPRHHITYTLGRMAAPTSTRSPSPSVTPTTLSATSSRTAKAAEYVDSTSTKSVSLSRSVSVDTIYIWRGRCKANPDNFESAELNTPASFYRQLAPVLLLVVRQRLNNLWTRVCVVYLITPNTPRKRGVFFEKK